MVVFFIFFLMALYSSVCNAYTDPKKWACQDSGFFLEEYEKLEREEELQNWLVFKSKFILQKRKMVSSLQHIDSLLRKKSPAWCKLFHLREKCSWAKRFWRESKAKWLALGIQERRRKAAYAGYSGAFVKMLEFLWQVLWLNSLGTSIAEIWWNSILCCVESIGKHQVVPSGLKSLSHLNTAQKADEVPNLCWGKDWEAQTAVCASCH